MNMHKHINMGQDSAEEQIWDVQVYSFVQTADLLYTMMQRSFKFGIKDHINFL